MNKKTVIFVKKELLFPDFWIFRKLNEIYWGFVFNFLIFRAIRKHRKDNLLIVSDYSNNIELEKKGIKCKTFGDYVQYSEQEIRYIEAKRLVKKLFGFDNVKNVLNYRGIDLPFVLEEETNIWFIIDVLYQLSLIKKVIGKENPDKIVVYSRRGVNGKCFRSVVERKNIKLDYFSVNLIDFLTNLIRVLVKKYSFNVRFHRLPGVIRREFVKTGNLSRIKPHKNNILILGFDKMYYSRIENVVNELLKSKENNVVMLTTKTNMQEELRKKGLNFVSFGDFLDKDMETRISRKNKDIIRLWKQLKNDAKFRKLFDYGEDNLWSIMEEDLEYYFLKRFKWIMYYIEIANTLLDKLGIDLVATMCDFLAHSRSVVMVANSKSIPTLIVQQGLQVDSYGRFFIPLTCSKMAAWGPSDKKYMEKFNVDGKRIVITGSPLHDGISPKKINENRKKEILKTLNLDTDKRTILLVSQAFEGISGEVTREGLFDLLISTIKNSENEQLIIKLHPRESEEMARNVISKYNPKNIVIVKREFDVTELIGICDVMVTVESTCIYDAILLKKPVISVNLVKFPEQVDYVKSGACIGVYNRKDFRDGLKKAYNKKLQGKFQRGRKKFIQSYFYKADDKASARVVKLMGQMINKK